MHEIDQVGSMGRLTEGPGCAAIFSSGLGVLALSVLAVAGDHSAAFKKAMIFYAPTGPLSGVTTIAIAVWILSWIVLDRMWRRSEDKGWAIAVGVSLMALGFVLMVPAVGDIF